MSVRIPTSDPDESDPDSGQTLRHVVPAVLLAVTLLLVGVLVVADGDGDSQPTGSDTGDVVPASELGKGFDPSLMKLTVFPGGGTFTGVAISDDGAVAIGGPVEGPMVLQSLSEVPGGFVWTTGPDLSVWKQMPLEEEDRAVLRSVTSAPGRSFIGGAVIGSDGTPTPALWAIDAGERFELTPTPVESSGWVEKVSWVGDDLAVVIEHSEVMRDRRSDRRTTLLAGEPEAWRDATPEGADVRVADIVAEDGDWVAVGSLEGAPAAWRSSDRGATWQQETVEFDWPGVLVDVVVDGDGDLAAVFRRVSGDGGGPITQLYRPQGGVWQPVEQSETRNIGWLAASGDVVVSGPLDRLGLTLSSDSLWRWTDDGWRPVDVFSDTGTSRPDPGVVGVRAAAGEMVVGSVASQPAPWRFDGIETTVSVEVSNRVWERVGPLPGESSLAASTDHGVVALDFLTPAVHIRQPGGGWYEMKPPAGWRIDWPVGFPGGVAVGLENGTQLSPVIVIVQDGIEMSVNLDGAVRLIDLARSGDSLVVLTEDEDGSSRREFAFDGEQRSRTRIDWIPDQAWLLQDGTIIGAEVTEEGALGPLRFSTDDGSTWVELGIRASVLSGIGEETILRNEQDTLYRFDPTNDPTVVELDTPDQIRGLIKAGTGWTLIPWRHGAALITETGDFWFLEHIEAEPVGIPLGPEHGLDGAPYFPVSGPDGYFIATEQGDRVLYQWTGGI